MPQKMKISGRITNYELGALAVVSTIPECECETPLSTWFKASYIV